MRILSEVALLTSVLLASTTPYVTIASAAQESSSPVNLAALRDYHFQRAEKATSGLTELLKTGAIKFASAADFRRLAKAWHARGVNVSLDDDHNFLQEVTYVVARRITIPAGMNGGNGALFLIEPGVPPPADPDNHNIYVSLANGRCVGANVQLCYSNMPEAAVADPIPGVRATNCPANIWRPGTVPIVPPGPLRLVEVKCEPASHIPSEMFVTRAKGGSQGTAYRFLPGNRAFLIHHSLRPDGTRCYDCWTATYPPPVPHTGPLLERRNAITGVTEWTLSATAITWWKQDLLAVSKNGRFALLLMPPATATAGSSVALVSLADGKVLQHVRTLSRGSIHPSADFVGENAAWIAIGNVTFSLTLNERSAPKRRSRLGRARSD